MDISSNALTRCALLVLAGAALAAPAAHAGSIVLQNQLPIAASCAVVSPYGDSFDAEGLGLFNEAELLDARLESGSTHLVHVQKGLWPVMLRADAHGNTYSMSPHFISLIVLCEIGDALTGRVEQLAEFVNEDFWVGPPRLLPENPLEDSADSLPDREPTFRIDPPWHPGKHKLSSYTPNDNTVFVARLQAADPTATAAQLLAGAPWVVELSAIPQLFDGSALHTTPIVLGRFPMAPPLDDDGDISSSGAASQEAQEASLDSGDADAA